MKKLRKLLLCLTLITIAVVLTGCFATPTEVPEVSNITKTSATLTEKIGIDPFSGSDEGDSLNGVLIAYSKNKTDLLINLNTPELTREITDSEEGLEIINIFSEGPAQILGNPTLTDLDTSSYYELTADDLKRAMTSDPRPTKSVSSTLNGLEPGTTYYARMIFSGTKAGYTESDPAKRSVSDWAYSPICTFTTQKELNITLNAGSGGSISPSGSVKADEGSDLPITITPDTGYKISSVTVDGTDVGAVNTYTITNISKDVTVSVTFEKKEDNGVPTNMNTEDAATSSIENSNSEEIAGSPFGLMQLRTTSQTNKSIKLKWKKIAGAGKYVIYANKCGKTRKYKKLKTVTTTSVNLKKIAGKKITKGTYYKFVVIAVDNGGNVLATSKTIHVATKGGKIGNTRKVNVNKKKVTLKMGKTFKIKATTVAESASRKVKQHRKLAYESSNPQIAAVSKTGKIKAVAPGTCYVYVYAQNGEFAKIKVTVKQ